MKMQRALAIITSTVFAAGFARLANSQTSTPTAAAQDPSEQMKESMELTKPGENHKLLSQLVGPWNFTGRHFSDDPNAKPLEFKGTLDRKSLWEGRYFVSETTGEKLKMPWSDGREIPYKDMSIDAYDNVKRKFFRAMIANHFDTGILLYQGDYNPANKTITYSAESDVAPGQKIKTRMLLRFVDTNHYVEEGYEDHSGRDLKVTELKYTRAKAK